MIMIFGCFLCIACSPQKEDAATNMETGSMTDADDNAGQKAKEENLLAEILENATDTFSNTLTETDSSVELDAEENQLTQTSDRVDEKAEPYIDAYINLSDDTEIEGCEWMQYGGGQVLRVKIQYKEIPEDDYPHKEDYFLFITQDGDVSNVIEVNYEDKGVGGPYGLETDCATQHQLGWACGFDAHFEDVTFDGEEDLLIFVGYAGASRFYCAYIYENGEFRYERTFEHIPSYVVDIENEVICGYGRGGATSFWDSTYKYVNGEFVLTESIDSYYGYINGESVLDKTIKTTYEYINGEYVVNEIIETTYEYEYRNGEYVVVEETVKHS